MKILRSIKRKKHYIDANARLDGTTVNALYKCREIYSTDRKHQTEIKSGAINIKITQNVEPDCKYMLVKYNTCAGETSLFSKKRDNRTRELIL